MLFRKKIEKACAYCAHGVLTDGGYIACPKKGKREPDSKCISFKYDPLKRVPKKAKAQDFSKYDEYDYSL